MYHPTHLVAEKRAKLESSCCPGNLRGLALAVDMGERCTLELEGREDFVIAMWVGNDLGVKIINPNPKETPGIMERSQTLESEALS